MADIVFSFMEGALRRTITSAESRVIVIMSISNSKFWILDQPCLNCMLIGITRINLLYLSIKDF